MEGWALAQTDKLNIATFTAWHTAMFCLAGYGGKLKGKSLSDFLHHERSSDQALQHARGIAFFHRLQARGIPVKITRNEIN